MPKECFHLYVYGPRSGEGPEHERLCLECLEESRGVPDDSTDLVDYEGYEIAMKCKLAGKIKSVHE